MSNTKEPRAVAVGILKGGFGKTTTAVNLARELAERNGRALVVDLDDNGHLTLDLGHRNAFEADTNHAHAVLIDGDDPREHTVDVVDGLDLFPAHTELESVQNSLKEVQMGSTRLKTHLVDELLGDVYDYIVVDTPANRGKLADNAMYATNNIIIPLRPERGYESGLVNTVQRLVKQAQQYFELEILAVVPNNLGDRIDQQTTDRQLLEEINGREKIQPLVPNFAYFTEADFQAIDAGTSDRQPGIRHRAAINDSLDERVPLRDYDPDCDQLDHYDELAQIVENRGVIR
ncbi:ParA family protein [Halobellus sp. Atlit-31R]|nr:ParA family protein [Halobellus sp. Atlit-31R]